MHVNCFIPELDIFGTVGPTPDHRDPQGNPHYRVFHAGSVTMCRFDEIRYEHLDYEAGADPASIKLGPSTAVFADSVFEFCNVDDINGGDLVAAVVEALEGKLGYVFTYEDEEPEACPNCGDPLNGLGLCSTCASPLR